MRGACVRACTHTHVVRALQLSDMHMLACVYTHMWCELSDMHMLSCVYTHMWCELRPPSILWHPLSGNACDPERDCFDQADAYCSGCSWMPGPLFSDQFVRASRQEEPKYNEMCAPCTRLYGIACGTHVAQSIGSDQHCTASQHSSLYIANLLRSAYSV